MHHCKLLWRALFVVAAGAGTVGPSQADSPSFMPIPANDLGVVSLGTHEARDSDEAKAGGPRIKVARGNQVFQFQRTDGTRVTVIDGKRSGNSAAASLWSEDDGKTWAWQEGSADDAGNFGPATASEEAAVQFRDNGEILSIAIRSLPMKEKTPANAAFFREHPGLANSAAGYYLSQRRSIDGWRTVRREYAALDTPDAAVATGDDGDRYAGFLLHHGIVELPNGDLLATMYGNSTEDQAEDNRSQAYPPSFKMYKTRVITVRSSDRGRTWGQSRVVASRWMAGRDEGESASTAGTTRVPAVTQEGFNESDLVIAANGDVLCLMRSGGRISTKAAPIYSTPLYQARSTDGGETWNLPVQIAPFGVNPNAVALKNGLLVASCSRPGGWLMFSTDHGHTWKGHRQLTTSDAYTSLLVIGDDTFTVYYSKGGAVWGEAFRVRPVSAKITD